MTPENPRPAFNSFPQVFHNPNNSLSTTAVENLAPFFSRGNLWTTIFFFHTHFPSIFSGFSKAFRLYPQNFPLLPPLLQNKYFMLLNPRLFISNGKIRKENKP